jgi:hypothetical protein
MSSAYAVVTKDCPEAISLVLTDFEMNGVVDDDFEPQDVNDIPYDGYNGPGMINLRKELTHLERIEANIKLSYKANSQCIYRGEDTLGKYVSLTLKGSLRPNAKDPATMIVYRGSLAAYSRLSSLKPLTSKWGQASLYYRGEWCSWGDCIPNHIEVGISKSVVIK